MKTFLRLIKQVLPGRSMVIIFGMMTLVQPGFAQQEIALYDSIPLESDPSVIQKNKDGTLFGSYAPSLIRYLPSKKKATGAAVIICPGGGYSSLVIGTEGYPIARYFAERGIAAFILKYRLPDAVKNNAPDFSPLHDARRAIALVKQHASEWRINPDYIGMMGFSAGGHLAAAVSTHSKPDYPVPDFALLVYPLIDLGDSLGHAGSRTRLLGKNPAPELVRAFSNETQVDGNTPPTLLLHTGDDHLVKVQNSLLYYEALQKNGVPAEMHIYPEGGHGGFVLRIPLTDWMPLCIQWIRKQNPDRKNHTQKTP